MRSQRCSNCGYRSSNAEVFRREKGWLVGLRRTVCVACRLWRPTRQTINIYASMAALTGMALVVQLATGATGGVVTWTFAGIFVLLAAPLTALTHELGHALAAKAVGSTVLALDIGVGKPLWSLRLGDTLYSLKIEPWCGGMVTHYFRDRPPSVWRHIVVLAAGSTANLIVGATLLLTWSNLSAWPIFATFVLGTGLSQLLTGLGNLWPRAVKLGDQKHDTDGRQILRLLGTSTDKPTNWLLPYMSGLAAMRDERLDLATDHLSASAAMRPPTGAVVATLIYVVGRARGPEAALATWKAHTAAIADLPESDGLGRAVLDNNVPWYAALSGDAQLAALADELSRRAIAFAPTTPAFNGTRGTSLAALGRDEEAIPFLLKGVRGAMDGEARAVNSAALARAYDALGNGAMAEDCRRIGALATASS